MEGLVERAVTPDGQWHDVARMTLRPGTWDIQYVSYSDGPETGPGDTVTGGFSCKIDVGGVVTELEDGSNGQFGQYAFENSKVIAAPTNVVWTCKNTVAKNGAPIALDVGFYVSETTPPIDLDSTPL